MSFCPRNSAAQEVALYSISRGKAKRCGRVFFGADAQSSSPGSSHWLTSGEWALSSGNSSIRVHERSPKTCGGEYRPRDPPPFEIVAVERATNSQKRKLCIWGDATAQRDINLKSRELPTLPFRAIDRAGGSISKLQVAPGDRHRAKTFHRYESG